MATMRLVKDVFDMPKGERVTENTPYNRYRQADVFNYIELHCKIAKGDQ